jgi:REP element-mobilizing transposase RayT
MPRIARRKSRSGVYHIMFRGNELREIFINDEDRIKFLQIFCEKVKDENFYIYAFCLMSNHVHILLLGEHEKLGRLVQRINSNYVYYFNKKYDRIGHLFHDRFKSEPVENDIYLLEAVRYIHNNPVKAGMVDEASDYRWSSFNCYKIYPEKDYLFINPEYIFEMFSKEVEKAQQQFIRFSSKVKDIELIDIDKKETTIESKEIKGEFEARKYIEEFLKLTNITRECIAQKGYENIRKELIIILKQKSDLSLRQIADNLGVNYGIVYRTKV